MQFRSIKTKLTIAIALIVFISLVTLGAASFWNANKLIVQEMETSLMSLAENNGDKLALWVNGRKSEISLLANSPIIQAGNMETSMNYLRNEMKRNPLFLRFYIIDMNGQARYTNGEQRDLSDRDFFKQARSGKTLVGDPVVSKVDGKIVSSAIAPIIKDGVIVGCLAGTLNTEEIIKLINEIKAGQTGYAYALQGNGLVMFHPNKDLLLKANLLTDAAVDASQKKLAGRMVKGEHGVASYTENGQAKYLAYAPVPGTTWSLAVNVSVKEISSKLNTLMWMTMIIVLVVLSLSVMLSFYLASSITKPLDLMKTMLHDVAQGQGDLTKRLDESSKDELGEASHYFNLFVDKLHGLIRQVSETTEKVAAASVQLLSNSERIANGAEEVAAQVSTVATAGEEMSATSGDIAQNCSMAAEGSQQASSAAVSGAQVVNETINMMNNIAVRVRNTAQSIENLGSRSEQIGAIIGTIEDIADQTNLLALNAAIEAARAGEQGRGFAVVADEVRALAERTTRATKEIGEMIRTIQHETQNAVKAMEIGVGEVAMGSEKATNSGKALERILQQINDVTMQINQVATAAEEQTATTAEISNNMHQITDVVAQTSQGAKESAASANLLSGLAGELRSVVGQFKL